MRFIYVTRDEDRAKLEAHGYKLLSYNVRQHAWCFENKHIDDMTFSLDINGVFSDTLMF